LILYADDAAVFLKPINEEVRVVAKILEIFGHASGLNTNRDKCAVFPIQCDNVNLEDVMQHFPCAIQNFPCTYLGLPLHFRQPGTGRVHVQPLIDTRFMPVRCYGHKNFILQYTIIT
jgi:hypothetical protein